MAHAWLPVVGYTALIFLLSSIPDLSPGTSKPHMDKVAHFVEYGIFGFLAARAWSMSGIGNLRVVLLLTILLGAGTGALDELWQGRFGRHTSFGDWVTDSIAVVVISSITIWWWSRRRDPHSVRR